VDVPQTLAITQNREWLIRRPKCPRHATTRSPRKKALSPP
jgi:hypothetical protein